MVTPDFSIASFKSAREHTGTVRRDALSRFLAMEWIIPLFPRQSAFEGISGIGEIDRDIHISSAPFNRSCDCGGKGPPNEKARTDLLESGSRPRVIPYRIVRQVWAAFLRSGQPEDAFWSITADSFSVITSVRQRHQIGI
jgi:hypothetical protein